VRRATVDERARDLLTWQGEGVSKASLSSAEQSPLSGTVPFPNRTFGLFPRRLEIGKFLPARSFESRRRMIEHAPTRNQFLFAPSKEGSTPDAVSPIR